jgi:glycosyltransferase involved in cell wall biosynthesis
MSGALEILVVHAEVPMADRNSLSVRLVELLGLMACEGHRVTLLARCALPGHEAHAARLRAAGVEVIAGDPERAVAAGWPVTGQPLDLSALLRRPWDVIWLSEYGVAEQYAGVARAVAPLARLVADSGDVAWVREQRGAELVGDPGAAAQAGRTRAREQAAYGSADALVAVSEPDAQALRELVPGARVAVISNIHAPVPPGPPAATRHGAVFVGNFHHAPNVDAVLRFHADTWPLVRARVPGARLTVVGTAPPPAVQALAEDPSVTVTGWVPAVRPYLDAARVAIAPLRFGAGVKGKVGEALAAGLPVVGTPLAFEGMPLRHGEEVLVADDPERFAEAIARLERDEALWERLAAAGRACIETALGRGAARTALRALLDELAPPLWHGDESAVAPYLEAHADGDPGTLAIAVAADPEAQVAALERLGRVVESLGRDPERIPDIVLVPGASASLPARARRLEAAA